MANFRFFALIFVFIFGSFGITHAKRKSVSWKDAWAKVKSEIDLPNSNPAKMKKALDALMAEKSETLDDKDGDSEPDFAETWDDCADDQPEALALERSKAASAGGFPYSVSGQTIRKSDLKGGSGTNAKSRSWARLVGCPGDDAGHIIANGLGGSGRYGSGNIFPQHKSWNRGKFRVFEQKAKSWTKCGPIKVSVQFKFGNSHRKYRPTSVYYTVEGKDPEDDCKAATIKRMFPNPMPSSCEHILKRPSKCGR